MFNNSTSSGDQYAGDPDTCTNLGIGSLTTDPAGYRARVPLLQKNSAEWQKTALFTKRGDRQQRIFGVPKQGRNPDNRIRCRDFSSLPRLPFSLSPLSSQLLSLFPSLFLESRLFFGFLPFDRPLTSSSSSPRDQAYGDRQKVPIPFRFHPRLLWLGTGTPIARQFSVNYVTAIWRQSVKF
ncbi:hypothetical protein GW17_00034620 [Ensete ventricosum]|nr:hypothetical protein GW17_00034620 [Ensete ventricosum]